MWRGKYYVPQKAVFCGARRPHRVSPLATTMTSPLAIPDIQRIVCELLLEERGRDGLYNLKLVSRSWASAVEPLIWQDLSHLVSLLRYLPQDAWTEDKYAVCNPLYLVIVF